MTLSKQSDNRDEFQCTQVDDYIRNIELPPSATPRAPVKASDHSSRKSKVDGGINDDGNLRLLSVGGARVTFECVDKQEMVPYSQIVPLQLASPTSSNNSDSDCSDAKDDTTDWGELFVEKSRDHSVLTQLESDDEVRCHVTVPFVFSGFQYLIFVGTQQILGVG
jgi:hypothetical protein